MGQKKALRTVEQQFAKLEDRVAQLEKALNPQKRAGDKDKNKK